MIRISPPESRREYVIAVQLPGVVQYIGLHNHWVDTPQDARRFDSMTQATIAAVLGLQLADDAFTVEAV